MKSLYGIVALIFAAELGYYVSALSREEADPCDLHQLDRADYCVRCQVVDPPLDFHGTCCGLRPRLVEVCVKTCFVCESCGQRRSTDAGCCPGARIDRVELKSPLLYRCDACGAPGAAEGLCDRPDCRKAGGRVRKFCAESGRWPHGGELARQ